MANPFMVTNPVQAMISTQKSLADIDLTDAQKEQALAHASLFNTQSEERRAALAEDRAIQKALNGPDAAKGVDPFSTTEGEVQQLGGTYKNTVQGEKPIFLKLLAQAADYDNKSRKTQTASYKASRAYAKERDGLLEKAAVEQNKWLDDTRKQMEDVTGMLSSIEGAPSYNIVMKQIADRFGPEALERNGLKPSITQGEYETPEVQDQIAVAKRQALGAKEVLNKTEKEWRRQHDLAKEQSAERDRLARRRNDDIRIGMERERIEEGKKDRALKREEVGLKRNDQVVKAVQVSLEKDQNTKKADQYANVKGKVDEINALRINPKTGKENPDWYKNLAPSDALMLRTAFTQMLGDFKDVYSSKYKEQEVKETMGAMQKAAAYLSTLGKGSPQFDRTTMVNVLGTADKAYGIFNANLVEKELQAMTTVERRGGDPDALITRGNYADFFRRNYNPQDPNSFVQVGQKVEKDGEVTYKMAIGTRQIDITKKMYDMAVASTQKK